MARRQDRRRRERQSAFERQLDAVGSTFPNFSVARGDASVPTPNEPGPTKSAVCVALEARLNEVERFLGDDTVSLQLNRRFLSQEQIEDIEERMGALQIERQRLLNEMNENGCQLEEPELLF